MKLTLTHEEAGLLSGMIDSTMYYSEEPDNHDDISAIYHNMMLNIKSKLNKLLRAKHK